MMPGLVLTVATLWTVATVSGRPGGDGDDAGRLWRKLNFGHRQRSRRQYPLRCVSWTARIRSSGPPRLEQQPDEYANHSMKEKKEQ